MCNVLKAFLASLIIALDASGTTAYAQPGFSSTFRIAKVFPRKFGVDIITAAPVSSPMGCSRSDAVRVLMSAANYDAIVAVLLTAFSGGKTVTVWSNSCETDGVGGLIAATVE